MRALIIANGRGGGRRQLQHLARSVVLIIAADGGAEAAARAGVHPHDAELALEVAAERGATEVVLAAALGGRVDHALANLLLVLRARELGLRMRLIDGRTEAYLVEGPLVIEGERGDLVSLVPLSPTVEEITTFGLRYPMAGERLGRGATRGISNVIDAIPAGIDRVGGGDLLLIHTRRRPRPS